MIFLRAGVALLLLLFLVAPASAHQSSFSYATLHMADGGKSADYEIRISTKDLFEALELDENRDATDTEIADGSEKLQHYVFSRIQIEGTGPDCRLVPGEVRVLHDGERFAQLKASLRCNGPLKAVDMDYGLFFDLDPRHEDLLTVDGKLVQFRLPDQRTLHYEPDGSMTASVGGFFRSGIHHVVFGLDHVLFLISLLLVVGLRLENGILYARSPWRSLRRTAAIASAFTLGHSLTLIAAALGWFELSSRFVESMIAASIVYVAVENLIKPDPPARALVGFGFGLMHGLGFAAMLRPLLTPGETILPLLVFNLGVEVGQLAIVACALPLLLVVIRMAGPDRYRRLFLPPLCLVLTAVGLLWLAERAFAIELVGF